ncbi:Transmembrane amino acid transporter protein [Trichostrongylus colubriformis]|uniref:Transmembrane amino acid transporter protein n=1 Tax=Trichostrongylus colubriformis TaxID=6319 RepID=A0AAN8F478_TRICO
MLPVTISTSICTLLCMMVVCLIFMCNICTVAIATMSIISICAGVFGLRSFWGIDLDPISMATTIMSIGFSVDFPAHITFHYFREGIKDPDSTPARRVARSLSAIGFPLLQCGISTVLFVVCLLFAKTYMNNMHPINGIRTHQENGRCHVHCHTENTFLSNISRRNDPPLFLGLTFDDVWQLQLTVPIYLVILIFPLLNFKSPTFFAKFNVLGTISVVYLLFINGIRLVTCGFSMNFSDTTSPNYVQNFNWNFPALTGMLTLSFFIHNCIITLLRNQRYPENNVRDLSIGYGLVAFSYIFVGLTFYVTFPLPKSCIDDNLLNNFEEHDPLSAIARVLIFFQLLTILPLVAYFIRSQISCAIFKTPWPG